MSGGYTSGMSRSVCQRGQYLVVTDTTNLPSDLLSPGDPPEVRLDPGDFIRVIDTCYDGSEELAELERRHGIVPRIHKQLPNRRLIGMYIFECRDSLGNLRTFSWSCNGAPHYVPWWMVPASPLEVLANEAD